MQSNKDLQNFSFLTSSLKPILSKAFTYLKQLDEGDLITTLGSGFGELSCDTEIKADQDLGGLIISLLQDINIFGRITVEGFDDVYGEGELWACVDPLDGSLNYASKGQTMGLPYSACISILSKTKNATFNDVIAAFVIDLRNGDLWFSYNDKGKRKTYLNHKKATTHSATKLDLGSMIVIGEMYYPENREKLFYAFKDEKGWLRNSGSAAYEMALVASGQITAFICDRQKQHELGAAYALVKGASGVALDFKGIDLGNYSYNFNEQTPVILAANMSIAKQILDKLNK